MSTASSGAQRPPAPTRGRGLVLVVALLSLTACGTRVSLSGSAIAGSTSAGVDGAVAAPSDSSAAPPESSSSTPPDLSTDGTQIPAGDSSSGSQPATSDGSPSTPLAAGDRNTAPMTVGLSYPDNSRANAALGIQDSGGFDSKKAFDVLIKGINAEGGLDGRKLVPVTYTFDSSTDNYPNQAAAACASFTQDHHVPVVIDTAFGASQGFGDCLGKAGVFLFATYGEPDAATSSHWSLHANADNMTIDRNYSSVLTTLHTSGYVARSNQLGVVVEGCAPEKAAYQATIGPMIRSLGLKAPVEVEVGCTTGIGSAGPAAAALSNAVLRFRQSNVDRVMFVSGYEATALLLFSQAASSQGYHPGYVLSSHAEVAPNRSGLASDQWPQLAGAGYVPRGDVDGATALLPVEKRCLSLARAGGVSVPSGDQGVIFGSCNPLLLLEAALKGSSGNSDPKAITSAVDHLGTSYSAPIVLGGTTNFSSSRRDGPNQLRPFAFNPRCTCMRYSGAAQPAR